MPPFLDPWAWAEELELTGGKKFNFPRAIALIIALILLAEFLPTVFEYLLLALLYTAPVWLPIVLVRMFYKFWMKYVQTQGFLAVPTVVLEVRLPREIYKSPRAMETVVNVFFHTGEPQNMYEKYVLGMTRPQSSLEIASFAGEVHFFIRTRKKMQAMVEAQIYSQYPEVEVYEVDDYMKRFRFDLNTMDVFGLENSLLKPDPYPIKTYVDFGLDKDPKTEFQVDPLAGVLELLGSMGPGENAFMQVVIRSHDKDEEPLPDFIKDAIKALFGIELTRKTWKDEAKKQMDEILAKLKEEQKGKDGTFMMHRMMTEEEKTIMEALGRNAAKKPFETGIRTMYIADKKHYRSDRHAGFPTMFRQFESHTLNGFKPNFKTMLKYKTHDPFGNRVRIKKKRLFDSYRMRGYFLPAFDDSPHFVLSGEELATVYHFPSSTVAAPGLARIPAQKSEAPPNLPM